MVATLSPVVVASEMMRIFPDSLVVASGIYAAIIQSFPYAVFFVTLIETTVIFKIIKYAATYLNITGPISSTTGQYNPLCRSGFSGVVPTVESLTTSKLGMTTAGFPSAPLFMLSTASSYIFTTLNYQTKELAALGPSYSSRYYISAMFLLILVFLFFIFRLSFECDGFGVLIVSVAIGLFLGYLLVKQNNLLFGPQSINLIGIPLLENRTATGKKMYVCPK
jgi:hypothetical protein